METTRNKVLKEMLETDIYATNVYTLGYEKIHGQTWIILIKL